MKVALICRVLILTLLAAVEVCAVTPSRIYIAPSDIGLVAGASQQFQVVGEDVNGNDVAVTAPVMWTCAASAGTISSTGLFTAGSNAGKYLSSVTATVQGLTAAKANVQIYAREVQGGYMIERSIGSLRGGGLTNPIDVTKDTSGNFYVLSDGCVVHKFDSSGNHLAYVVLNYQVPVSAKIAVHSSASVYVLDPVACKIQKYGFSNGFVTEWGSNGAGTGQFREPKDIAVDSTGRVYVADSKNCRIQVFDSNGAFIRQWETKLHYGTYPDLYYSWFPCSIHIDSADKIWVEVMESWDLDNYGPEIHEYNADGQLLLRVHAPEMQNGEIAVDNSGYLYELWNDTITKFTPFCSATGSDCCLVQQWGSFGDGSGQFHGASGLTVDASGKVYVADYGNHRVQVFNSSGSYLSEWESAGVLKGQFSAPAAVTVDNAGNLFVADSGNYRIQQFDTNGKYIRELASRRQKDAAFACPGGLSIGASGKLLVADSVFNRILSFSSTGILASNWALPPIESSILRARSIIQSSTGSYYITDPDSNRIITLSSNGSVVSAWGEGLQAPVGIAQNSSGMIYVADSGNNRIRKFSGGLPAGDIGAAGIGNGQFNGPAGICVDTSNNLYVVEWLNNRVQKFDANGNYLCKFGSTGSGPFQFTMPEGVTVDGQGNLYIADTANNRVLKYIPYAAKSSQDVKQINDGAPVQITGAVVTAAFPGFFYIESDNRSSGIRVNKTGHGLSAGMRASITGTASTADGERCITATTATEAGSGAIDPIAVSNKALGGGNWHYDAASGIGQCGIIGASGLNNLGLLIRTFGRVTFSGSGFFYIDDGSGLEDGSGNAGVKVLTNGFNSPAAGVYVQVTGISSCYGPADSLQRLIRTRAAADVVAFGGAVISGKIVQNGGEVSTLVESAHPYANNLNYTWTITAPSPATMIRVHFSSMEMEYNHDYLYIYNSANIQQTKYNTSKMFTDLWSSWVSGSTVKIKLTSDASGNRYGFQVDKYELSGSSVPVAGVTVTLTPGNLTTQTDTNGSFSLAVPNAGPYTLTPSLAGAAFTPASKTVTVTAGQALTGVDFNKN